jgi:PKD domain-containing protein
MGGLKNAAFVFGIPPSAGHRSSVPALLALAAVSLLLAGGPPSANSAAPSLPAHPEQGATGSDAPQTGGPTHFRVIPPIEFGPQPNASLPHWRLVPTPSGPPPRADAAVSFDPERNATVVFGGYSTGGNCPIFTDCPLGDTWEFMGGAWTNVTPARPTAANTPSARWGASMTYDAGLGGLLLFGGTASTPTGLNNPALNDSWKFVAGIWSRVCASSCRIPTARWDASLAFDPETGSALLFGGATTVAGSATNLNDTWTFDSGRNWTQSPSGVRPSARTAAGIAFDGQLHGLVLFGGIPANSETWLYQNSSWTQLAPAPLPGTPSPRGGAAMSYDPLNGSVTLFGGCSAVPCAAVGENDTWVLAGQNWFNLTGKIGPAPSGRGQAGFVASENRGALVLFGGASGGPTNDTWMLAHVEIGIVSAAPYELDVGNTTILSVTVAGGFGPVRLSWGGLPSGCASANVTLLLCADNSTGPDLPSVYVTAVDPTGETVRSAATPLIFNARPTVHLVVTPLRGIAPLQVSFLAQPSGGTGGETLAWEFGDGTQAVGPNPTHEYGSNGTYSVTVWANDTDLASGSAQTNVTVVGRLFANVSFSGPSIVVGHSSTLEVRAVGGTPPYTIRPVGALPNCGAAESTGSGHVNYTCTPNASGQYAVTLHVSDSSGQSRNVSANLTVAASAGSPASGPFGLGTDQELLIGLALGLGLGLAIAVYRQRRRRRPMFVPPMGPEGPIPTANLYVPPEEPRR